MLDIRVVTPETSRLEAYRVVPDPDDPVIFQIQGHLSRVIDISAIGVTTTAGSLQPGQRYTFLLDLPTTSTQIEGQLDTFSREENGRIGCKFTELSPTEVDALHHYVLFRQKQVIRALKSR